MSVSHSDHCATRSLDLKYVLGIIVSLPAALLVERAQVLLDSLVLRLRGILYLHVEQTLGPHWPKAGADGGK